jgi:hypothetical protein
MPREVSRQSVHAGSTLATSKATSDCSTSHFRQRHFPQRLPRNHDPSPRKDLAQSSRKAVGKLKHCAGNVCPGRTRESSLNLLAQTPLVPRRPEVLRFALKTLEWRCMPRLDQVLVERGICQSREGPVAILPASSASIGSVRTPRIVPEDEVTR